MGCGSKQEFWALARAEWRDDKSDMICKVMGNCNCPGDEHGADPETAICFRAAKLIDGWAEQNKLAYERSKAAK